RATSDAHAKGEQPQMATLKLHDGSPTRLTVSRSSPAEGDRGDDCKDVQKGGSSRGLSGAEPWLLSSHRSKEFPSRNHLAAPVPLYRGWSPPDPTGGDRRLEPT